LIKNLKELLKNKKVLILVGPTGIGKTKLSFLIAEKLPVEIISADSRQIYKYLDIGTAKPTHEEINSIPHHLIDFLGPDEDFSAGKYSRIGRKIVDEIFSRKKIPIVVGGSGLYVRALIDGLVEIDIKDTKIRTTLRKRMTEEGPEKMYRELQKCDFKLAEKIKPNDRQRILRGLEIYLSTGMKLSKLQEKQVEKANFDPCMYGLKMERRKLYDKINARVDEMMGTGFIVEVIKLLKMGYKPDMNSLSSVGYKEIIQYLNKDITYEELLKNMKQKTRRYAKRQMTWFRADSRIKWMEINNNQDFDYIAQEIFNDFISQ